MYIYIYIYIYIYGCGYCTVHGSDNFSVEVPVTVRDRQNLQSPAMGMRITSSTDLE